MSECDEKKHNLDKSLMNVKEAAALDYLETHKLIELFESLTSSLIYSRPENPKEYLLERIEQIRDARAVQHQPPRLFDESNITSLYRTLDATNRGYITNEQYHEAIKLLGIKEYNKYPTGMQLNRISLETFVREIKLGLQEPAITIATG
ncbi:EF-hand calcium-binding domain-containing protein 10 [Trichoplax sp. H2]|nr:EF-hand calcium-binding domain-containing protein 10 [Trichoplax sp. H2]|eukprot:RDD46866.1 EF-hand calcium-binding domain-containing protein 10 [Trichoplax sp. H2]